MLSLPEKLMLLALHDEKGSVISSASTALPFGLAGALIIELVLQGKITIEHGKVEVLDQTATDNVCIDKALDLISKSEKLKDVKYWVQKINSKIKDLEILVVESLIKKGVLRREEKRILWVIPMKRYPMVNVSSEYEIRSRLHQIVIQQDKPTEKDIALLSLVNACDLVKEVFKKEERKRAKERIKNIIEKDIVGQAVSAIVKEIMVAVSAAVAAGVVTAAASHS